jgi:hypothetical protein
LAEQVGVNAPGNPKITTRLPAVSFATSHAFGPIAHPSCSLSKNSYSVALGSFSPI